GRRGGEGGGRGGGGVEVDAGERLAGVERLAVPVVGAVVAGGERRVVGVPARQQPRRQRDAGDDSHPGCVGGGQRLFQRLAPERGQEDLPGGHPRPADRGGGPGGAFPAYPPRGDAPLGHERVQGVIDRVARVDRRG